jgi:hypothetical protein
VVGALWGLTMLGACGGSEDPGSGSGGAAPGALIRVTADSRVGVLLEDLPPESRDRAASVVLARPTTFWVARARQQLSATHLRLAYRRYFSVLMGGGLKGQLPLPPEEQRSITLDEAGPQRTTIDGHDVVAVGFHLTGTILTDPVSPIDAEPALADVGGTWDEPFTLPVDPDLVFQRIGYACEYETTNEPHGVDAENALTYYDDLCQGSATGPANCHVTTPTWPLGCKDAVAQKIGRVETSLHYERLPWDASVADAVRMPTTSRGSADLQVMRSGLEENRVVYRYIEQRSCAVVEQCVKGLGWRRLLQFTASLKNIGSEKLHIGDPTSSVYSMHNLFEFSVCHEHYHFRFYGDFTWDPQNPVAGDKRAFCIVSSSRYLNDESTPLTVQYDSCSYQGIGAGWGDDYPAGIECQWIDVTSVDTSSAAVTRPLQFKANPDQFLCEGTPILDDQGKVAFEATPYTTESGLPIERPMCDFRPDWEPNNVDSVDVTLPAGLGGMVTSACARGQLGPLRDCGYAPAQASTCTPGSMVTLSCSVDNAAAPQLVRFCESSVVLGGTLPCTHKESLASTLVQQPVTVSFVCPAARDAQETGGRYGLLTAPVFDGDPSHVTCTPQP